MHKMHQPDKLIINKYTLWSLYQNQCHLLNLLKTTKRKVKHVQATITSCTHQLQNSRMTAVKNFRLHVYTTACLYIVYV